MTNRHTDECAHIKTKSIVTAINTQKHTHTETHKKELTIGQPEWFVDQIKIKDTLSLFPEGHWTTFCSHNNNLFTDLHQTINGKSSRTHFMNRKYQIRLEALSSLLWWRFSIFFSIYVLCMHVKIDIKQWFMWSKHRKCPVI